VTTTATTPDAWQDVERGSRWWWVVLLTGIGWTVLGIIVLDADLDSAATIGLLVGGYLIAAGVMEFALIGWSEGWKWLHAALGVLFVVGGLMAFGEPFQTFAVLAKLVGFLLVMKGVIDFVIALGTRHDSDLWWAMLIAGVIEMAIGFWASGYPGRSATLLLLWVGVGAFVRGILQIILAFRLRGASKAAV
jgi:uncharacterized membrane protein HdeD (DUF308 family)